MSVSEKLQQIAENEQRVYDAGKRAERNNFWEIYQNGGKRTVWTNAFTGVFSKTGAGGWTDETYNPIYPIIIGNENLANPETISAYATQMYYYNGNITDTKVDIYVYIGDLNSTFNRSFNLKTIRKLVLGYDNVKFSYTFALCEQLQNITFEGVIANSISFADSPLLTTGAEGETTNSVQSIINALMTITDGVPRTIQFHQAVRDKLTPTQEDTIVNVKKWTLLPARTETAE